MRPAAWQYYKSPRHPRDGRRPKQWDLLRPVAFRFDRYRHQTQSPLFQLPPELRALIFRYALGYGTRQDAPRASGGAVARPSDYLHRFHFTNTDYHVPIETALLRTCQRVYQEAWWIPLATSNLHINQSFTHSLERHLGDTLEIYHRRHSLRLQSRRIEIDHVRLIGTPPKASLALAHIPYFYPRRITLTVSKEAPGHWTLYPLQRVLLGREAWLPPSVRELHFELEAPDQMRGELLLLANLLRATWAFDRIDGVRLAVHPEQQLQVCRSIKCSPIHYGWRHTAHCIGVTMQFRPLDKDDVRCSIPMELPTLSSRGKPLIYGEPERCYQGCPPLSDVDCALQSAKYPFVSRSWIPPPPLPEQTRYQHGAGCGITFLCDASSPLAPTNLAASDPAPTTQAGTVTPTANVPTTTLHATNTAPATSAAPGQHPSHCGGAVSYGTSSLPDPSSAVTAPRRWRKIRFAWWHCILYYFLACYIIAQIVCACTQCGLQR